MPLTKTSAVRRHIAFTFGLAAGFAGLLSAAVLTPQASPDWHRLAYGAGASCALILMVALQFRYARNTDEYLRLRSHEMVREASLYMIALICAVGMLQAFAVVGLFPVLLLAPAFGICMFVAFLRQAAFGPGLAQ